MQSRGVATPRQHRTVLVAIASVAAIIANGCGDNGLVTAPVYPPGVASDTGHYSIAVSGVLNGSTHVDALPLLVNANQQLDFVGFVDEPNAAGQHADWIIEGSKALSDFGPRDGWDLLMVQINPNLTTPGTYKNNSCPFQNTFLTKCIAVDYDLNRSVSNPTTTFGRLQALADDRDSVLVEAVGSDHIKLSIVGPWAWHLTQPAGTPQTTDTVFVRASFDAYRVH